MKLFCQNYQNLIKKLQNIKNEDTQIYNDLYYKSSFILSNNYYEETKTYELEIPDDIDE
ncbi:hypothetical protein C2G38_2227241 [Gigaspora rosea]|uniref:Uncharacterized protein n=1 Tax=Gigaspora rosea TaxID=44941 RepID=A0A397TX85_9GLOM|nr:hypothetical protein C2G38_2227241 [Gigaspora rosea]